MTNREIMIAALKKQVFPGLLEKGYKGKYPHFIRKEEDYIEFISFLSIKGGGAFYVETSVSFPKLKRKNCYFFDDNVEKNPTVIDTIERYRLSGMIKGEFDFYYSDVYTHKQGNITFYEGVLSKEKAIEYTNNGYECLQQFDSDVADDICVEINKQLEKAYKWMTRYEKNEIVKRVV